MSSWAHDVSNLVKKTEEKLWHSYWGEKQANCGNKCFWDLKWELKRQRMTGAVHVWGCMFIWSLRVYKNVLNAIMENGEATVLGLRRSKPLFLLGGSFSYSKQPHKRLPVSLATSPSDLGPFISLPSLSMTCPHQGSYKIRPFPMKHQQTFWRVWLSPRWISGVSTPPHPPFLPYSHLPLSSANTTPLWANLRSSTSPLTGSGHGNAEPDKGRATEEGETCTKPFSWRSQYRWWEEDALRAAGGAWYGFHRLVSALFALPGSVEKSSLWSETLMSLCCWTSGSFSIVQNWNSLVAWVSFP